ncbi:MAG TPA: hypothetical protein PK170_12925, partial [Anaerolineae bacterium]|nr:hypothetical protein [Anaerolineae bacterium]
DQWQPLSLDQVLQRLDKAMPNYAVPVAGRALTGHNLLEDAAAHNITKLATTAWFMGQTAVRAVGDRQFQPSGMDAAAVAAALLDENGLLPDSYTGAIAALLDVFEAGGPVAWLQQQWNLTAGIVQGVEDFVGSFLDWTPSLTMPGEATFLSWTHTAINALNFLALVTGEKIFGQVASILTTIIEVYRTVRVIVDTIIAAVDAAANGVSAVLGVVVQELANLARPLGLVGMIFSIGLTWLSLSAIIGDLPPGLAAVAISNAVVQTVIMVVLFVLAAAIPLIGTAIAVIVILTQALSELIGEPLTPSDLTALILTDLFTVEVEQSVDMVAQEFAGLKLEALDPLGGLVEGRRFEINMAGSVTLQGTKQLLDNSYVSVMLGKWLTEKWANGFGYFYIGAGKTWSASIPDAAFPPPKGELTPITVPGYWFSLYNQEHYSKGAVVINPYQPARNASVKVDMLLDARLAQIIGNAFDSALNMQHLYCGDGCWEQGTTPQPPFAGWEAPGPIVLGPMKFDVIPDTLYGFWT